MAVRYFEVPYVPELIRNISDILVNSGLTRKTIIKGDTIEANGEAGIGKFYIIIEEKEGQQVNIKADARNNQSLDIIINLVKTGIEDLDIEFSDNEEGCQEKEMPIPSPDFFCTACQGDLVQAGSKQLLENVQVKIMVCPKCNKIELYKE